MLDWGDFAHRQHLATSGDFLGCHYGAGRSFLASVGQRGAANHPIVHGMPPTAKNSWAQDANNTELRSPLLRCSPYLKRETELLGLALSTRMNHEL